MLKISTRRILQIGYGCVGIPFLHSLLKESNISPKNITLIDMKPEKELAAKIPEGVKFINMEVTDKNYIQILDKWRGRRSGAGDFIIDLSVYVNTLELIKYCTSKNMHLITTSVEPWQPSKEMNVKTSIADDMINLKKLKEELKSDKSMYSPTIIINHGMNPGMVSHFIRMGLKKWKKLRSNTNIERAKELGIQTIHISEIDTQVEKKKSSHAFRNTWSIDGLYEEGSAHSEIGLGTHEKKLPKGSIIKDVSNTCKLAVLPGKGVDVKVKSWVPMGQIHGHVIQHGEAGSICMYLSDEKYRPTVHYAYKYSKPTEESIKHMGIEGAGDVNIENKVLTHTNAHGTDQVGVLAICEDKHMYWAGSSLDSKQSKEILDIDQAGPTSLQVVGGVLSAMYLCLKKTHLGLLASADEIPEEDEKLIWKVATKYMGTIICSKLEYMADSTQFSELLINEKNKN